MALAFERLVLWREAEAPDTGEGRRTGSDSMNSFSKPLDYGEYVAWIAFWAQFIVLAAVAILGAFFASEGGEPGDYSCGLWLSFAAIALAFMRLKQHFDAGRTDGPTFPSVDDVTNPIAILVVFVILGLAGLFLAADNEADSLHDAGLVLFGASGFTVFLSLKHVFSKLYARR
jgi:hypothetical protein